MAVKNFETETKYPSVEYRRLLEYTLAILRTTDNSMSYLSNNLISCKETIEQIERQKKKMLENDFWLKLADFYVCGKSEKLEKESEKNIKAVQTMLENPDKMFQAIYFNFSSNYHLGLYSRKEDK